LSTQQNGLPREIEIIEIQLPPKLHHVAEEFNRMISRIHASEDAFTNLARRDGLTQMLNRRAFDEELSEVYARHERLGETFACSSLISIISSTLMTHMDTPPGTTCCALRLRQWPLACDRSITSFESEARNSLRSFRERTLRPHV
jgi:hypothetical protein